MELVGLIGALKRKPSESGVAEETEVVERKSRRRPTLADLEREQMLARAVSLIRNGDIDGYLDITNTKGVPIVVMAARNGIAEIVAALVERGADPNLGSKRRGETALLKAAERGFVKVVQALLAGGADPDKPSEVGLTPLIQAASAGELEVIRALIAGGADVRTRTQRGDTPIQCAEGPRAEEIRELLRGAARASVVKGDDVSGTVGLKTVGTRRVDSLDLARGCQDFLRFMWSDQPEWCVVAVEAPIDKVGWNLAAHREAPLWEPDIAGKKIPPCKSALFLVKLRQQHWTIVVRSMFVVAKADLVAAREDALLLAQRLQCRTALFTRSEEFPLMRLMTYRSGEIEEEVAWDLEGNVKEFRSRLRKAGPLADDGRELGEILCKDLELFLPVCYPESDGYQLRLVAVGLGVEDIERADCVVLDEGRPS